VPVDGSLTFYCRNGELCAELCAGVTVFAVIAVVAARLLRRRANRAAS